MLNNINNLASNVFKFKNLYHQDRDELDDNYYNGVNCTIAPNLDISRNSLNSDEIAPINLLEPDCDEFEIIESPDSFNSNEIEIINSPNNFNDLNLNQKENLIKRQGLIEKIKDLIVVDENPNKLYSKFKLLKEEWHNTGQVPITDRNNIWETYRHHVGKFYDFLHLNRDLRELDFKHNYEEKVKIIEKAEELDKLDDIIKASRDLNDLHRLWKNELGPVAREHSDDLWKRFQDASQKIH